MTLAQPFPRTPPLLTGGGGTVIELLLGLGAAVTATLASRAWRHARVPPVRDSEVRERPAQGSDSPPTRDVPAPDAEEPSA